MSAMSQPTKDHRRWYLNLRPRTARILAVGGIGGAWSYFFLKFLYGEDAASSLLLVGGILQIAALLSAALLFFSTYSYISHAPSREIDERELAERYRAHYYAFQYIIVGLILSSIGTDVAKRRWDYTPSIGVVDNFIWTLILTSLIMPAALLAFWDREP